MTIPRQATAWQVGHTLEQNKLVRSGMVFVLWAKWKGLDGEIKAGDYRLSDSLSVSRLLDELTGGSLELQTVTIPEGFTTDQIADLLAGEGLVSREFFYQAVIDGNFSYSFLEDLPRDDKRLEGYLFPDTYHLTRGLDGHAIIEMMLERFAEEIEGQAYPALIQGHEMSLHQVVTIASMIEREAKHDQDKPLIAGVIYNRMTIGMPMQIDATVQYALGTVKPRLTYSDLEVDSPYNTYIIPGLPPGPIAMPGEKSLQAALHPIVEGGYYYYLAKPDGFHVFAETLAEHYANEERYLQ